MPESATQQSHSHRARLPEAMRALAASLFINALCPYVLYCFLEPHFAPVSLVPLAFCGLFPLLGLTIGFARQRALDIIGLFALVEVAVAIVTALMAHSASGALLGRTLQNLVLSGIFFISVLLGRPIMLYVARQFVTGNNAGYRARFDQIANRPDTMRVYKVMTLVWAIMLLLKNIVGIPLALSLSTRQFLVAAPIFNYGADIGLVWWSMRYGYSRLGHYIAETLPAKDADLPVGARTEV
jgi:hypothetical protein